MQRIRPIVATAVFALLGLPGCQEEAAEQPPATPAPEVAVAEQDQSTPGASQDPQADAVEPAAEEETAAASESSTPGPPIGAEAPRFMLTDQHGESQSLSDLLNQGQVALVFYRSADW